VLELDQFKYGNSEANPNRSFVTELLDAVGYISCRGFHARVQHRQCGKGNKSRKKKEGKDQRFWWL
jgi:hypothetical protein